MKRITLPRPKWITSHRRVHGLLHATVCRLPFVQESSGSRAGTSTFTFIIRDGTTQVGVGGALVSAVDAATFASGEATSAVQTGIATVRVSSPTSIIANLTVAAAGYHQFSQTGVQISSGKPYTLFLTPISGTQVQRGAVQFNINALITHVSSCWNQEVGLWSTSEHPNCNSSGCGNPVQEKNMFWLSEENEVYPMAMYEHGFASQAITAIQTQKAFNPWTGTYRNQILYGALLPVQGTGGRGGCQLLKTGTFPGMTPCPNQPNAYTVNNNPALSIAQVSTTHYDQNGSLAYSAINDFIRGGTNWQSWIQVIENAWDGIGFKNGSTQYTSRGFGAAGCAILICNYDPRGIFPAMDLAASKLQGSDGSFPNSYTSLSPGIGDAESCNKFFLWDCPQWLAFMQSLKGSANMSTPYASVYTPPSYIPA